MDPATIQQQVQRSLQLVQQGQWAQALEVLDSTVAAAPAMVQLQGIRGSVLLKLGRAKEAVACFRTFVVSVPPDPQPVVMLADALRMAGDAAESERVCVEAGAKWPGAVALTLAWGRARMALGDKAGATEIWGRAAKSLPAGPLQPIAIDLLNAYGCGLVETGRGPEAVPALKRVVEAMPGHLPFRLNLAMAQRQSSLLDAAADTLEKILSQRQDPATLRELAAVRGEQSRLADALALQKRLIDLAPNDPGARSDYLLTLQYTEPERSTFREAEHKRVGAMFASTPSPEPLRNDRNTTRKLRVGYVSADFQNHPVAAFVLGLFRSHNHDVVESVAYHTGRRADETTSQVRAAVNTWREVPRSITDEALAEQIRADQIDVLVDLSGHTGGNRLGAFSHRAAPVQLHYLAYPGTTGVPCVDGFVTDQTCYSETESFSEKRIVLPRCLCSWMPLSPAPAVAAPPLVRSGYVTLGSMHAPKKMTDAVLSRWAEILRRLPDARLRIVRVGISGATAARLTERLVAAGADVSRVDFIGTLPNTSGGHLQVYSEIDLALDVFPFSGHTTAIEGLYMGVPIVTHQGSEHRGRMVSSVLSSMDLQDLVAESETPYVDRVVELCGQPDKLIELRRTLRDRFSASPLNDHRSLATAMEEVYRTEFAAWAARP